MLSVHIIYIYISLEYFLLCYVKDINHLVQDWFNTCRKIFVPQGNNVAVLHVVSRSMNQPSRLIFSDNLTFSFDFSLPVFYYEFILFFCQKVTRISFFLSDNYVFILQWLVPVLIQPETTLDNDKTM